MKIYRSGIIYPILFFLLLLAQVCAQAATIEYQLSIGVEQINITGTSVDAMTINGSIPGPTLRFTEGDIARIHVQNRMKVDSSIHWHGLLVPPDMDGVPNLTFPPIKSGETFIYEFPIRQHGTYWYHSHTELQEQRGLYGSIVIEPQTVKQQADRDHVVLLSDWTDENPYQVLRNLKRGSEWYALEKGSAQSIFGAARLGMLGDYFKRELQRMPPMDIADVAYDCFLANGQAETSLSALAGETVRLRIINGSATTYFYLEFAGGPMTIIAADGQNVEPLEENRFLIGVAETYDVLVQMPESGSHELRATAHDGSSFASAWLGSGHRTFAPDIPKPNLYHSMGGLKLGQVFALTPAGTMGMEDKKVNTGHFDTPGMTGMDHMDMGAMHSMPGMEHETETKNASVSGMDHGSHSMQAGGAHKSEMKMHHTAPPGTMDHGDHAMKSAPGTSSGGRKYGDNFGFMAADVAASPSLAMDGMDAARPWPPYAGLKATASTILSGNKPIREIRLTLDGDMERYLWFLNNKPLSESDSIRIEEGEIVRFIMVNRTMMHHPMHLHGHFFRVINGQGDHAPLKHTVDVAPMSTTVIEFDANEVGDWFFHCHLLYHMKSGMARVVHYNNFTPAPEVLAIRPRLYQDSWYFNGQADLISNMSEGFLSLANSRNILTAEWEAGWQDVDGTEWEGIFTYDRYLNRFFTIFAGVDLQKEEEESEETRGVLGFSYLLPLNIESRVWLDSDGGSRFSMEKDFHLTPRISFSAEVQYDTHDLWEGGTTLAYMLTNHFSISGRWHSEYGFGAGLQLQF